MNPAPFLFRGRTSWVGSAAGAYPAINFAKGIRRDELDGLAKKEPDPFFGCAM